MGNFKKFHEENSINENDIQNSLIVLAYLSTLDGLNESELTEASILAGISGMFSKLETGVDKIGMKLHKGKGLIDYAKAFTGNAGKLIFAAIKKDKEAIKEITKTFEKAEFIDFLLKLDLLTMHLITGPIHMVDAITGWDLMANLKQHAKKAESVIDSITKAISDLKVKLNTVMDAPASDRINSFLDSIGEMLFGKLEESLNEAKIQRLILKKEPSEKIMDALYDFVGSEDYDEYEEKNKYIFACFEKKVIDKIKSFLVKSKIEFKEEEISDPVEEFNKLDNNEKVLKLFSDAGGKSKEKISNISFKFSSTNGSIWNDYFVADFSKRNLPYDLDIKTIVGILRSSDAKEAKQRV